MERGYKAKLWKWRVFKQQPNCLDDDKPDYYKYYSDASNTANSQQKRENE